LPRLAAFQANFAAMIPEDFLADGQTQPDSILFPVADKRLEQLFANRPGNTWSVVLDADLDLMTCFADAHRDEPGITRNEFTCIAQQIDQRALHFPCIEPGFASAFAVD